MNYKLALLPGDGIGPEITEAAVGIMHAAAGRFNVNIETNSYLFGGCAYDKFGAPITDETIKGCSESDAVFLGAVGGPKWESLPQNLKPEAALLKIRKSLGLFANLRPSKVFDGMLNNSSLKKDVLQGSDFLVVRELTGGIYFGQPREFDEKSGFNTMIYTKREVERIAKVGFETARRRRKKVTSVDKANVLEVSQFWRNVVHEAHKDYPDVELEDMYVDNCAMQIVRNPKQFDVILTSNLFGDILSDIGGMITGSLGMLPSASIGEKHALFEPVHGSAPDIAGKNIANPIAAVLSAAMLFDHTFNMTKAGEMIRLAVEKTLNDGYATPDIAGGNSTVVSTTEMTEILLKKFNEICDEQAVGIFLL